MAKKSLIQGAAVLAAAGLLVKFLGAFFRLPLAGMIGAVGMANYAPAYYIYNFLLVFATAGLPIAISKMVSERYAIGQFREAERVFKLSRTLMALIGLLGACFVLFFSDAIAVMINNPGSALPMKSMAPALLLVPIMASYRGYFQGMQEMSPTAISQVAEQIFRVICGLFLAWFFMSNVWIAANYTDEARGAAGGCLGAATGAVGGLLVMLIIYMRSRKQVKSRIRGDRTDVRETSGNILKQIALIAIPITIGSAIMPIVNLLDAGIVTSRLLASGWDQSMSEELYGQLSGFASPLVAFPQVLVQAIVLSLVPLVSAANKRRNDVERNRNISLGVRMTMILALPCAAGLVALAGPVLMLLYPTQKASALSAAPCLQTLSIGFIFLASIMIMTGALQGIGKQMVPVVNLLIGVVVKFIVTWILTAVPEINVAGAAVGTASAYLVAAVLDLIALKRYTGVKFAVSSTVIKPLISSVVMGVLVYFVYQGVYLLLGSNGIATILAVIFGVGVYGLMILRTKAVTREEILNLSKGRKIVALCDKLKLW
ncbi:MAG: polysaccharide biosynthesis protein [Bacillota bacterium]|nr:polysaccharide biosynthesis protein [Bacillota bacterium]